MYSREMIMELVQTDLPEPVVPAMSRCGIRAMSPITFRLEMSLPTAKATWDFAFSNSLESMTLRSGTGETKRLGTSMPTTEFLPGIGAMRTLTAPRLSAISAARLVILLSLTPRSSSSSYRVTEGPLVTSMIFASMPKDCSVSASSSSVSCSSFPASAPEIPAMFFSRSTGGYLYSSVAASTAWSSSCWTAWSATIFSFFTGVSFIGASGTAGVGAAGFAGCSRVCSSARY